MAPKSKRKTHDGADGQAKQKKKRARANSSGGTSETPAGSKSLSEKLKEKLSQVNRDISALEQELLFSDAEDIAAAARATTAHPAAERGADGKGKEKGANQGSASNNAEQAQSDKERAPAPNGDARGTDGTNDAGGSSGATAAVPVAAVPAPATATAAATEQPEKKKGGEEDKQGGKAKNKGKDAGYKSGGIKYDDWTPPKMCVPICGDVREVDFNKIGEQQLKTTGRLFDVIMTDPPWQLASANPTRGVAIGYLQLADFHIKDLPLQHLQTDGYLFVWVINAKYRFALSLFEHWGYELVDEIVWVKQTVNRRLAKSHGYYLQHAKETCLVGRKGNPPAGALSNTGQDVIWSQRRGQSQKPEEIYELIHEMVPGGSFLEIFGRRNNLHDYWVTVGNEL